MPAKSAKQYGLMQAIAHGTATKGMGNPGPSRKVAEEFIHKTPSKKRKAFSKALMKKKY